MGYLQKLAIIAAIIIVPSLALARPPQGFHEGPYIRFIGGMESVTFDNNRRTNQKVGQDYEGTVGFQFGWNLWDSTAAEFEGRYVTTQISNERREHVVNVNLNIKYSFITNGLTDIGYLHILPFVQGGPAALFAAVPGDPSTSDKILSVYGLGFGGGAGIDFLIGQYVYFGALFQADLYYVPVVRQNMNGSLQRIVGGDWEPQIGILGAAGVHF